MKVLYPLYTTNMIKKTLLLLTTVLTVIHSIGQKRQSDNGNGTYTNPVIASDFPDPDVIRVDDTYYFISTTMFIFPGATILKSKDLVNWEFCSNVLPRMDFSPCYNMDNCHRYRHGQWASSLKYHNGQFYCLFNTLDEGGFLGTSNTAEGPWKITHLPKGFYDPGLFFDDNGKIYVAHGYNKIYITEVDSNLVAKDNAVLVFTGNIRKGLEGSHVYKRHGYYYIYGTYGGLDGFQVALRSRNIYGPYEQKIVIRDTTEGPNYGIHQGALIETQTGEWWTLLMVDSGPFGRFASLQPILWKDNWPIAGLNGKAVVTHKKPNVGKTYPIKTLPTSDEFNNNTLGMQWGWNHNPEPNTWSLIQKPDHLRLKTTKVVDSFPKARNTLTQRIFAYYSDTIVTQGTLKMDFDSMTDGDIAGLGIFQKPYGFIGIKKQGQKTSLVMVNNGDIIDSIDIETTTIYLRANPFYGSGAAMYYHGKTVSDTGTASFSYSFDNISYKPFGNTLQMQFDFTIFTGNKFCLFNYATKHLGGHVDFDWFRVSPREQQKH